MVDSARGYPGHSSFVLRHCFLALKPDEVDQELAPKIEHPAPGIFHFPIGCLFENALVDVMRDLIPQIFLDLRLNPIFIERIDRVRINAVITQKFAVTLIQLPE